MLKRLLLAAFLFPACASTPPPVAASPAPHLDYQALYDELLRDGLRAPAGLHTDLSYCEPLKRQLRLGEECLRTGQVDHYKQLGVRMQAVQMLMPMDPANKVDKSVGGGVRRPLHAKAHACVKAFLQPIAGLPAPFSNGLLSDGKPHATWIRFSNAKGIVENDSEHDARGMAMKIMSVTGPRLAGAENQTQDFLMTNKPRGTARDAEDFVKFAEANAKGKLATLEYFADNRMDQMLALLKVSNRKVDSMVKETYWSGGPFLWGITVDGQQVAAKFKMQACTDAKGAIPDYLARDVRAKSPEAGYLRADLKTLLAAHDLCMVMSLQLQKDPVKQPIEDGFQEWSETEAPTRAVAYLKIPRQTFDSGEQDEFCERLTFNPWNGLAAHRPLGDLNRARRYVYGAVQQARLNALPAAATSAEPKPDDAAWNLNPLPNPL